MRLLLFALVMMAAVLIPVAALAEDNTLRQSVQQPKRFPFRPDCDGNTKERVACLWRLLSADNQVGRCGWATSAPTSRGAHEPVDDLSAPVAVRKDDIPATDQAAPTNVAGWVVFPGDGGLI